MSLKSFAARIFATRVFKKQNRWMNDPLATQLCIFRSLIRSAEDTAFGKDHNFNTIENYQDFASKVPVRDYEGLRPYVDRVVAGEQNILWPGKPKYLAKTSGTTSGAKYIPITEESIQCQVNASRDAILNYIHDTGKTDFIHGKMIFLQGSPILKKKNGMNMGRLSGISAHYVPSYLQKNRLPSWETNCIEDWETKVERIIDETIHENMSV
ncbi:MAG: GH3 auxin-responsive promoter family protein, partial [Flavobacteriaceae bacterium]|nr:GH3 auxin-responsive promoter family protein [Flavobacteriaceae bacterium]